MAGYRSRGADPGIKSDVYRNLSVVATGDVARAAPAFLDGGLVSNTHATNVNCLKIYNKATAPTQADTPILTIPLPPKSVTPLGLHMRELYFDVGISVRAVTEVADSGTTAAGSNEVVVNLFTRLA